MKLEDQTGTSIIEEVRALKRENAAACDFDVARIVAAARARQEQSGRVIVRRPPQNGASNPGASPSNSSRGHIQ